MEKFTFTCNGVTYHAQAEHFTRDFYNRFRIYLEDGRRFVIGPVRFPGYTDLIIWDQILEPGILAVPADLYQAAGEGLEAAGIY